MLSKLRETFNLDKVDIRQYSPLTLAYIGDAVYDVVIRSYVISKGNVPNKKLHNETIKYVSAKAQSQIIDNIMDILTEDEANVYKKGTNAKPHSMAKNASQKEYLKATGLEALVGYLFIKGEDERLLNLIKMGIN